MSNDHSKKSADSQEPLSDNTKAKVLDTPDAHEIKHSDGTEIQALFEKNPNNWRSEGGLFAITDNGETLAKQKEQKVETKQLSSEIADTGVLDAIRQDPSVSDDKKNLASQYLQMRTESKARGFKTDVIDQVAGEQFAQEIRARRSYADQGGMEEASTFKALMPDTDSQTYGLMQPVLRETPLVPTQKIGDESGKVSQSEQNVVVASISGFSEANKAKNADTEIPVVAPPVENTNGKQTTHPLQGRVEIKVNIDSPPPSGGGGITVGGEPPKPEPPGGPERPGSEEEPVGCGTSIIEEKKQKLEPQSCGTSIINGGKPGSQPLPGENGNQGDTPGLGGRPLPGQGSEIDLGNTSCGTSIIEEQKNKNDPANCGTSQGEQGASGKPGGIPGRPPGPGYPPEPGTDDEPGWPRPGMLIHPLPPITGPNVHFSQKPGEPVEPNTPKPGDNAGDGNSTNTGNDNQHEGQQPPVEIAPPGSEQTEETDTTKIPKPEVPPEVMAELEKELLEKNLVVDGKIPKEKGQEAADLIRDRLRPYTVDINGRNIALFIVEIQGTQHVIIGISGEDSPGAEMPETTYFIGKKSDSEYKILHEIIKSLIEGKNDNPNPDVTISGYTEQKPCNSCKKGIEQRAPQAFEDNGFTNVKINETTWTFNDSAERENYNRSRYKGQKNNQPPKDTTSK